MLQSDTITLLDIPKLTDHVQAQLSNLLSTPLLGGWVSALNQQMVTDENGTTLKGNKISW